MELFIVAKVSQEVAETLFGKKFAGKKELEDLEFALRKREISCGFHIPERMPVLLLAVPTGQEGNLHFPVSVLPSEESELGRIE